MPDTAFQLYSARNGPPVPQMLGILEDLGYARVEGYGALYPTLEAAKALRSQLAAAGLEMPTGHIGLDVLEGDPETAIAIAKALGMRHVIGPYLAPADRPVGPRGWEDFAARLDRIAAPFLDQGIGFGWHNHDFELENFGGRTPLDIILTGSSVEIELDLGWVHKSGHDPIAWIERTADRLIAVHLKDVAPLGAAEDEDGWADLGHGEVDWPPVFDAVSKTSAAYQIVEHDNPSDPVRFARRAIEALG